MTATATAPAPAGVTWALTFSAASSSADRLVLRSRRVGIPRKEEGSQ